MGADNAIDLVADGTPDGALHLADDATPRRTRAHFRGDRARLAPIDQAAADPSVLRLAGTIEQASYLGHGFRYRVRVGRGQVWVDDPAAVAEGSRTHVVIPRDALLMFPT
jgi:hypothetical protein